MSDPTGTPRVALGPRLALVLALVATMAGPGGCRSGDPPGDGESEAAGSGTGSASEVVAWVRVAPVRRERIAPIRHLIGRGSVPDGSGITVSAPFDCRVVRLLVVAESPVSADALLAEVEPTPAARVDLDVAAVQVDSASDQLEAVQALYDRQLTTHDAVLTAQGELAAARARLRALRRTVSNDNAELRAPASGVVRDLSVSDGAWLSSGQPLLRLVRPGEVEALVGIERRDAPRVAIGDTLTLTSPDSSFGPVEGRVTALGTRVDPSTGAIDLHVAVAGGTGLMEDQPVLAELTLPAEERLVIPHAALVPREAGFVVFTVEAGDRVREVPVTVTFEVEDRAAVEAPGLVDGAEVVVEGNYPLADAMRVRVRP